jgi:hypothetical protein
MKEKYNFYTDNVQEEIDKNRIECLDILEHNEKHLQKFKKIYKEQF